MKVQPLARQSSLVVKEIDGETLIYDRDTDEAHCLNSTAARVWKSCDGTASVKEIAQRVGHEVNSTVDENVVWLALEQLEKFKLLQQPVERPHTFAAGMTRRQAVRALGVAAIALPMVTSIIVPTATSAISLLPLGFCCNNPNQCGTGCCAKRPTTCTCVPNPPGDPPCIPSTSGKQCADTASPTGPTCQDL